MLAVVFAALSLASADNFQGHLNSVAQALSSYVYAHSTDADFRSVAASYFGDAADLVATKTEYSRYHDLFTRERDFLETAASTAPVLKNQVTGAAQNSTSRPSASQSRSSAAPTNGAIQAGVGLSIAGGVVGALLL